MAGQINKITANIGSASYDIVIGSSILHTISNRPEIISADKVGIIVSSNVYELHEDYIKTFIDSIKNCELLLMADGEENKNYKYAEMFLDKLIEKEFSRKSLIIGIGGGVVGDFSGYIASLYMRGISVIHIPTTLLAMVDASIGGKVAVNLTVGKNIVGAFHQPKMVISDIHFLNTLPDEELKNGLTEALKHGLIGDRETVRIMENNDIKSIRDTEKISKLILLSASFKASVVEKDEKEKGQRAILNYGHTIGHAIESLMEYKGISHGEAVAIGMYLKLEISKQLTWLNMDEVERISNIIDNYELIKENISIKSEKIIEHMKYDKKNSNGKFNFVLLKGIGNPLINQQIDEKILNEVLGKFS